MATVTDWNNKVENCYFCHHPLEHTRIYLVNDEMKDFVNEIGSEKYLQWKLDLISSLGIKAYKKIPDPNHKFIYYCDEECLKNAYERYSHLEIENFKSWSLFYEEKVKKLNDPFKFNIINLISHICSQIKYNPFLWDKQISKLINHEEPDDFENFRIELLKIFPQLETSILAPLNFKKLTSIIYLNACFVQTESQSLLIEKNKKIRVSEIENKKVQTSSLYLIGSLFNHSCNPNLGIYSKTNSYDIKWVALKRISKGDQIFNSYISTDEPVEKRRSLLLNHYNFVCECEKCLKEIK